MDLEGSRRFFIVDHQIFLQGFGGLYQANFFKTLLSLDLYFAKLMLR